MNPSTTGRRSWLLHRVPAILIATAIGTLVAVEGTASAQLSGLTFQYQLVYSQTSTAAPTPSTSHEFTALMSFPGSQPPSGVDDAWVEKPDGSIVSLNMSSFYSSPIVFYPTREAMLTAWPSGLYEFVIEGRDEDDNDFQHSYTKQQPYPTGVWANQVPTFTPASYTALQGMNPALPLPVEVNAFVVAPPANGQLSGLSVVQRFGTLPGPTAWSSLTTIGSPTSTRTIPAGALQPNTDYYATWYFSQRVVGAPTPQIGYTHLSFNNITRVPFRTGNAVTCPPDLGIAGGAPGSDGQLDNNDFIAFITHFFNDDPRADTGVSGGLPGSDDQFDNNDFIAFINAFFTGC